MTHYGFVLAPSKDVIESVSARKPGEYGLADCAVFEKNGAKDLDISRILFIAKSNNPQEVHEAITAVRNVYNSWCLNHRIKTVGSERYQKKSDWFSTAESCTEKENGFVYVYRQWRHSDPLLDEAFYVGMSAVGGGAREIEHIQETIKAINGNKSLISSKQAKIRTWLENRNLIAHDSKRSYDTYDTSQHNLVNRIVEGITPTAAFAIENFLIFHFYGVYKLSNSTNGNSDLQKIKVHFISRPRVVSVRNEQRWHQTINQFLEIDGELKQTAKFDLQLISLSDGSDFEQNLINEIQGVLVPDSPPRNIGADVEWSWKFAVDKGPSWVRFQLKFSATHAQVAINLRRSKDVTWSDFRSGILRIWSNPGFSNDRSNNIYFKPFGIQGRTRTVDTWFSYDDLSEPSKVPSGYPRLIVDTATHPQEELALTLPQAITKLVQAFLCSTTSHTQPPRHP